MRGGWAEGVHGRGCALVKAELMPPSALGESERAAWRAMAAAAPDTRRAFFAPGFARACETAHGRARVAVLHEGGALRGFLPLQFATGWHRAAGLAERIGGELNDAAGLVALAGVQVNPRALLRQAGIGALFITHLTEGQAARGLASEAEEIGHVIGLSGGGAAYHAALDAEFQRDTARRLRRAEREFGPLRFEFDPHPDAAAALALIGRKRAQYARTGAADPFAVPGPLRLIAALCDASAPDCQPTLARLWAGERVLAAHFGLLCHGVLSYWFPVYDPAAEKVSPGRLLLWHLTGQAEACGITLIDRGAGDNPAKRDFSTGTRRFGTANLAAGGMRGGIARLAQAAQWRLAAR